MDCIRKVVVVVSAFCASACSNVAKENRPDPAHPPLAVRETPETGGGPSDRRVANEARRESQPPFQLWLPDHIRTLQEKARDGEEVEPLPHRSASSYDFCDSRMGSSRDKPSLRLKRWNQRDFFEVRGGRFLVSLGEHEDCDDVRLTWLDDAKLSWVGDPVRVTDMTYDDFGEWLAVQPEVVDGERQLGAPRRGFLSWMKRKVLRRRETYRALVQPSHCYLIDHSHRIYNSYLDHNAVSIFRVKWHGENETLAIDQVRNLVSLRQ